MENTVKLIHLGSWYRCYGDDAKIISYITEYKLFEDIRTRQPSAAFPDYLVDKVIYNLRKYKINYTLVNDSDEVYDFGRENNYQKFLYNDLPYSFIVSNKEIPKNIKGYFIVRYENEDAQKFVINENISPNAELVKSVLKENAGETIIINDEKVEIIEKNISYM